MADLTTMGFAPVLTQSYNTGATPGTTTPFPNVFGYDQSRLATASNSNYSALLTLSYFFYCTLLCQEVLHARPADTGGAITAWEVPAQLQNTL